MTSSKFRRIAVFTTLAVLVLGGAVSSQIPGRGGGPVPTEQPLTRVPARPVALPAAPSNPHEVPEISVGQLFELMDRAAAQGDVVLIIDAE